MESTTSKQTTVVVIAALIIGLLLGVLYTNQLMTPKSQLADQSVGNTYEDGWRDALEAVGQGTTLSTPDDFPVTTVQGTVQQVSGSEVVISVSAPHLITTPALRTRTVTVAADTHIVRLLNKDPEQLQKEFAAFNEQLAAHVTDGETLPEALPTPPEPFEKQSATVADIQAGDVITIITVSDVRTADTFTATEIQISTSVFETEDSTLPPDGSIPSVTDSE